VANPEVALVASLTGWPASTVEILVAFVPALFLELVAALGFYAVTRPSRPTPSAPPETPVETVLRPKTGQSPAAAQNAPIAAADATGAQSPAAAAGRRLVLRPAGPSEG